MARRSACQLAVGLLLCSLFPALAYGDPVWPSDASWVPVTVGSGYYVDPLYTGTGSDVYATPPSPEQTDLVGGLDSLGAGPFPTGYFYMDASNIYFRMRVDNDPTQGMGSQLVWTVFLNTDADPEVDFGLSLDAKSDDQVELVVATTGGPPLWNPVDLPHPHSGVSPLSTWSRFINATNVDGSHFHNTLANDDDFFVDLAFPLSTFLSTTGLGAGDPFQVAFATSADDENINKDLPDYTGWSNSIPEPTTLALLAGSFLALLRRRK